MFLIYTLVLSQPPPAAAENQQTPESEQSTSRSESSSQHNSSNPDTPAPEQVKTTGFNWFLDDTAHILTSPLRADTSDWLKVGGVIAVTGGLLLADTHVKNLSQHMQSSTADSFASVGQMLGSPAYTIPTVGAFYLYGYFRDDRRARTTSVLAMESLAISTVLTETLKVTAQRSRPNSGASPFGWEGPRFRLNSLSFCSGHTSSAFSIATVFAERYKESTTAPAVAYGLATLAGLSRVYDNKHWTSDIFFGAALGYFIGKTVVGFHPEQTSHTTTLRIMPDVRKNYNGMVVAYSF